MHALTITRKEGFVPTLKVLERAYECAERFNDGAAIQFIKKELLAAGHRFNIRVCIFKFFIIYLFFLNK